MFMLQMCSPVWSKYFKLVYGSVPTRGYPICVWNFAFIYSPLLKSAGFTSNPATTCPWNPAPPEGQYYTNMVRPPYAASFAAAIYNSHQFQAIPSKTWVEITHGAIGGGTEAVGSWMYYAPGSAVWFNTGANSKAYPDHGASMKEMCGKNCGFGPLFTAAKAKGYTSIQYIQHADQSCGRISGIDHPGRQWSIEIVDTNGVGQFGCGAQKSSYRAGWEAEYECMCSNGWTDPAHSNLHNFNCAGFAMRHGDKQNCGANTNNDGPALAGMPIASTDACDCAAKCKGNAQCAAWTWSKGHSTVGGKNCWLRSFFGKSVENCGADCWSGTKPKFVGAATHSDLIV